jgi:small subunit ribosomal protein S3Ae
MAIGKNNRLSKRKKVSKKKTTDQLLRKEWYNVKAPNVFSNHMVGKTPVTRSSGTKTAIDALKGRVFEVSLADLQMDEDQASRKIKLRVEQISGQNCLTNFWGMDLTKDKIRSLFKKWQTTIETNVDIKIKDGYVLRVFVICFTRRRPNQKKRTSYALTSQIRQIRKRIVNIIIKETSSCDLKEFIKKLMPEAIGKQIE